MNAMFVRIFVFYIILVIESNKTAVCQHCGKRFEKENEWQEYCNDCKGYQKIGTIKRKCIDCHKPFDVDARNTTKIRCDDCQHEKDKERKRKWWNKNH